MKINIGILLVYTIGDWIKVCVLFHCVDRKAPNDSFTVSQL